MLRTERRHRAFTLVELLVAIAIIAVLIGLLLPAVQKVRAAAAGVSCKNQLKQLALAAHQYHDANEAFPPGHRGKPNADGLAFTGWPLSLLPHLEQQSLYTTGLAAFRQTPNFVFAPPHTPLATYVPSFHCAADAYTNQTQIATKQFIPVTLTNYFGVSGTRAAASDGVLYGDSRVRMTDIPDGTSNTLLFGERPPAVGFQFGWWYAGTGVNNRGTAEMHLGVREVSGALLPCAGLPAGFAMGKFDDACSVYRFWSFHSGGANFAISDGSVRFLSYSADSILPALATRGGGEVADVP